MLKKYLPAVAAALLSLLSIHQPARAQSRGENARPPEKVKADVALIGPGQRVQVRLRNGEKLTGYVGLVGEQEFVLTRAKEGTKQTVAYADVSRVKVKNEKRVSTAGKILIVMGVMWAVAMVATG
ncbi:MAG TPA: hypothetical protein VNZ44_12105, partial [Pyrinomonadaceae bacterium]|nr:hypothetical protein [Pyrinomonadaceae bacterium]